jgi:predicted nucleic acid-binding protein
MPHLVDSDWVIDWLAGAPGALELLDRLAGDGIAVSIITYMEVYQGVERSADPRLAERRFESFLESIPLLPSSTAVAMRCARLRELLRRQRRRVNNRALDLLIAATTMEHGLVIVTRNVSDYADIPGLRVESGHA